MTDNNNAMTVFELLAQPADDPANLELSRWVRLNESFESMFSLEYLHMGGEWTCRIQADIPLAEGGNAKVVRCGVGPTTWLAYADACDAWGMFGCHPRPKPRVANGHHAPAEREPEPERQHRPAPAGRPRPSTGSGTGSPSDEERDENGWISKGKERMVWAVAKERGLEQAQVTEIMQAHGSETGKVWHLPWRRFKDAVAELKGER